MSYAKERIRAIERERDRAAGATNPSGSRAARLASSAPRQSLQTRAVRAFNRWKHAIKRAGLTPESYDALLHAQGCACRICGAGIVASSPDVTRITRGPVKSAAVVYISGQGTVLLCHLCAMGMSCFRGSKKVFDKARELCAK